MAISTNTAIEYFGTQDDLDSSSAAVTNTSFSVAGDLASWTNDDDAVYASVIFEGTFSVAPTANTSVDLFARPINIEGTNDQTAPDANYEHHYVGSFPLNDQTAIQQSMIDIGLPNGKSQQEYEFYIRNNGGQTVSAGWTIFITPKAIGPHA